jgi:hypothetical protein
MDYAARTVLKLPRFEAYWLILGTVGLWVLLILLIRVVM